MKDLKVLLIAASVMALSMFAPGALADPPGREPWEARKGQIKYEREQSKRDYEWAREQRKRYEKMEREERKHRKEMAREERKHLKKMEREERKYFEEMAREDGEYSEEALESWSDDYYVGQPVDDQYRPVYVEDKVYRIIKDVRSITDTINQ